MSLVNNPNPTIINFESNHNNSSSGSNSNNNTPTTIKDSPFNNSHSTPSLPSRSELVQRRLSRNLQVEEEVPARDRLQKALANNPESTTTLDLCIKAKNADKLIDSDIAKICKFTNLKTLNLSGHEVCSLPDAFPNSLTRLESLDLSRNHLKALPKNCESCSSIIELSLRLNSFKTWPMEINKMKLRKLDFAFNDFQAVKPIKSQLFGSSKGPILCSTLKSLDLSFNHLTAFPTQIYVFSNLEELTISRNNIGEIPDTITKLDKLRTLKCEEAGLVTFPETLCNLHSLQVLNLTQNKIPSLPIATMKMNQLVNLTELYMNNCELKGWSQLYCQVKLRVLHLNNNQIHGIPPEVSNLCFLQELRLNRNNITHVPDYIANFKDLKILDLSYNAITEVDEKISELQCLEVLLLQHNMIPSFPESASNLTKLIEINLNENKIPKLPNVSQWTQLTSLEASSNRIKSIPDGIGNLTKLQKLDLTLNYISSLPDEFFQLTSLQFLRLKHNELDKIPEKIALLTKLEELNIDYNSLGAANASAFLHSLTNLKTLKLISMNYNFSTPFTIPDDIKPWVQQYNVKIECDFEPANAVMEKLYLGSANAASNKCYLQSLGITHILTAAGEVPPRFPDTFTYMVIHVEDARHSSLKHHFHETTEFIDDGRKKGCVLVHCMAGVSRSATIVTAYVMLNKQVSLKMALKLVHQARPQIQPNPTFIDELKQFDKQLAVEPKPAEGSQDSLPPAMASSARFNKVEIYEPGKAPAVRERKAKKNQGTVSNGAVPAQPQAVTKIQLDASSTKNGSSSPVKHKASKKLFASVPESNSGTLFTELDDVIDLDGSSCNNNGGSSNGGNHSRKE